MPGNPSTPASTECQHVTCPQHCQLLLTQERLLVTLASAEASLKKPAATSGKPGGGEGEASEALPLSLFGDEDRELQDLLPTR